LRRKLGGMSLPQQQPQASLAAPTAPWVERHDTLRMLMEWIADRFRDAPEPDTSIDWEDGEEHDEPHGPPTL
jgi:hypothetical protein